VLIVDRDAAGQVMAVYVRLIGRHGIGLVGPSRHAMSAPSHKKWARSTRNSKG
ncbi:hypothetical protein Pmar_PMAR014021, partial [Perkinsus marinus ATCC 50983]